MLREQGEPIYSSDQNQDKHLMLDALRRLAEAESQMETLKGANHQLELRIQRIDTFTRSLEKGLADLTYRHEQLAMHLGNRADVAKEQARVAELELQQIRNRVNKLTELQANGVQIDKGLQEAQSRAFWIAMSALNSVVELTNEIRALGGMQNEAR